MPRQFLCPVFGSSLWLALILQSLISSAVTYRRPVSGGKRQSFLERTLILLDVNTRSPVKVLNDNFLSLQLDPSIIKDGWLDFLSSKRLVTLARGLSPAYLRFGGKRTDFLQFHNLKNLAKFRGPGPDYYLKNYEDDIVRSDFALDKQKGCKLASHPDMMLELQREKAAQMQQVLLKEQLSNIYSDVTLTGKKLQQHADTELIQCIAWLGFFFCLRISSNRFMKNGGSVVDAVTWQHYYIDRRVTKVEDFLKTRLLDTLSEQITKVLKIVQTHAPEKRVWLGGVGPAWAGGTNNLSDTFAAGFLWLNTLGIAAAHGIDVVLRHSFFDYGYNHLVDQHFNPLPDYWLSLLFKRLVGPRVLAVHVAGLQRKPRPGRVIRDKLRIYAHCTSFHNHDYVRGSITIYIINLHRSRKKIKLAGTLRNKTVHQYLLQPFGTDGLHSMSVQLNGEPLRMVDNETFPELKPRTLRAGRTIAMPPVSIGFYVIKNINAYACRR
uniref:Heparanase 2 n=1 Tax=Cyprinus carpio TaxID=7962 RepID=A0A8C1KY24_CYPCA